MTKYLSQRDLKWAGIYIANAPFTVGQKGCALISLVNLWQSLNRKIATPELIIKIASNVRNFTKKSYPYGPGLIYWDKVCAELGGIKFEKTEKGEKMKNILSALADPNRGVILEVNSGAHFVLAWSSKSLTTKKDLTVMDPWYGDLELVKKMYHNIVGARYFRKI